MVWAAWMAIGQSQALHRDSIRLIEPAFVYRPVWVPGQLPKAIAYKPVLSKQPAIRWRGVHLFVGPKALAFQTRLMDRVLKPLGFNEVVLECERTRWRSIVGKNPLLTTSRRDLAGLFTRYRARHIEPIPLIESFGHMKWLLDTPTYRGLALGKDINTIDPTRARSRRVLTKIWQEAAHLLHPKTVHFGLDEVGLAGPPSGQNARAELWSRQVRFLAGLARELHVRPMFWGDEMLAPNEGPDNCSAASTQEAATRRAPLPKNALIGDWHYVADPNPEKYNSLRLWRANRQSPIATEWCPLANIVGTTLAARLTRSGTLITTWAGYSSDEASMLANPEQFYAFVFASEANADPGAGAHRLRTIGEPAVRNDLRAKFQSLFYGPSDLGGLGWTARLTDKQLKIPKTGSEIIVCNLRASALILDIRSLRGVPERRPVAQIDLTYSDGSRQARVLLAGIDVATPGIASTFRAAGSRSRLPLRQLTLRSVGLRALNKATLSLSQMQLAR